LPEIIEYDVKNISIFFETNLDLFFLIHFKKFLLENGGLTGNWDDYDHGTFLRIRNKYKVDS